MFKPLLKTIPSLSGNMKIVCNLEGYNKKSENLYECYVNEACLTSISNDLYDKNIKINLKNNNFEYDVMKFFKYYPDTFYKTNYSYSKINIPNIDFTSTQNDTNKDFQYGCKRISYKKSNNTCAFFAPIYIESLDDIKGKYFLIKLQYKRNFTLTKYLKIKIYNDNENINYLGEYLERYAEKIDDKVIYCSKSYKNIYYGISLLWGGFVRIEDNISSNIYRKYYTINDFDALINNGFKRNSIMMKQIINLSFYFDPMILLDENEKNLYQNCEIIISGQWKDNENNKIQFYNFSDNYNQLYENIYNVSYNKKFNYISTQKNIMNLPYPSLNESCSENYKYINTVSKNYNRWKLKYSSDEYPYIINLNYAFSNNQNSLYMYKEFPLVYSPIQSICNLIGDIQYNLRYDFLSIYSEDKKPINNPSKYFELFNQNYITNFFNILVKEDHPNKLDNEAKYMDIFSSKYNNLWGNVNHDGKLYYKGILYDFNKIYNENPDMNFKIDKFSIFVCPKFSYITANNFNNIYKETKYLYSDENNLDTYPSDINKFSNNIQVKIDPNGEYIKYTDNKHYKNDNLYYNINDILILAYLNRCNEEISNQLSNLTNDIIEDYRIIDVYNRQNIYSEIYKNVINYWNIQNKYNDSGIIYREQRFLNMETIYNIKDKLFFSVYPSKTKYLLLDNVDLLSNIDEDKIVLYEKTKFINVKFLHQYISNSNSFNLQINILDKLDKYYLINGLYNKETKILYSDPVYIRLSKIDNQYGDKEYSGDENFIYVDTYNLENIYLFSNNTNYKRDCQPGEIFTSGIAKTMHCKFLNMEHIGLYFDKTHCFTTGKTNFIKEEDIISTIKIKVRSFRNIITNLNTSNDEDTKNLLNLNINYDTIVINDEYIPIEKYGLTDKNKLLLYISYDSSTRLFRFTEEYFNTYLKENNYLKEDTDIFNYPEIVFFELCYDKPVIKLDEKLYHIILNKKNDLIFKDLYLYHLYNPKDYIGEMYFNKTYLSNTIDGQLLYDAYSKLLNNNEECLVPYFNEVWVEDKKHTKIYSDYFLNNIIETDKKHYRYNTSNIDLLIHKSFQESSDMSDETHYSIINTISDTIDCKSCFTEKGIINEDSLTNLNQYSGMLTYQYNGINYGFYVINSEFDNTKNTLNIINESFNTINCVDYINGISVEDMSKYTTSYLGINYKYILPYISSTNIVKTLFNNVVPIIKPQNYKLENSLIQYPNKDNNITYSYTIYYSKKKTFIDLARYFDNIVPLITPQEEINSYYIYYKNTDKFIENNLNIKHISYIQYNEINNINKYSPIKYFDNSYYLTTSYQFTPIEYKYYNSNKIIMLDKEISIKVLNTRRNDYYFKESEITSIESNKDYIFELFYDYIRNSSSLVYKNDSYKEAILKEERENDINNILFLYNKYSINFIRNQVLQTEKTNLDINSLYTLTIIFTLL